MPAGVDPAMSRSATVVRLSDDLPRTIRKAAWGIACRLSRRRLALKEARRPFCGVRVIASTAGGGEPAVWFVPKAGE